MIVAAATALTARLFLKSKSSDDSVKEVVHIMRSHLLKRPLDKYATDYIIAYTDSKIAGNFKHATFHLWNL